MKRRFLQRYDIGGIPRDRWLASIGKLSDDDRRRLRAREFMFASYRTLRALALMPVAAVRSIATLSRLLGELERLHCAPRRKMREGIGCVIDIQTWLSNG